MSKKIFVYAHPDDEATSLTAIKRSAETSDGTNLICVSNGDSNVKRNGIRELETQEALSAYMGRAPSEVSGMIDFCGFSETEFREALLSGQVEKIAKETMAIREKFAQWSNASGLQLFTNFPDGGDARHLYTAWVVTNIVFPYLKSKGVNTEVFGNPKQTFDARGNFLGIGCLPKGWAERLPFAEPANVPEIGIKNGVLALAERERIWLETLFKNQDYYASQRTNDKNGDLFNLYMRLRLHEKEHFYQLNPDQLDYKKLQKQLPVIGFEAFGKQRVRASAHNELITYDHFLRMIERLQSQL